MAVDVDVAMWMDVGSTNFVEKFYEQQTNFVWLCSGDVAPWVGRRELILVLLTLLLFFPGNHICMGTQLGYLLPITGCWVSQKFRLPFGSAEKRRS